MAFNITWLDRTDFKAALGVTYEAAATIYNTLKAWAKSPVQQITGSLDDTDIIIDGTKNYADTIVVTGSTRTITANASGHLQGNNIKQRYTFDVDCTITLSGFDATGNNTGTITPIPAGTYDFQYFANRNGRNLEIAQNIASEASPKTVPSTWYVHSAPEGKDSNVGSDKFPFETIQHAHDTAEENDTIVIQDIFFEQPSTPATSITKSLIFKGVTANISSFTQLRGTWTITSGKVVRFENISLFFVTLEGTGNFTIYLTNCSTATLKTGASRFAKIDAQSSIIDISTPANYRTIVAYNCKIVGDLSIGFALTLYDSLLVGNCTTGLDSGQPMALYNSTIQGDVTVTASSLSKFNSVITGAETVSGTTTSRQARVFDDNVLFKSQATVQGITVSFSATPTFNFNSGNVHKMPITGDITSLSISNELPSGVYTIFLTQDSTGGHSIPLPDSSFGSASKISSGYTLNPDGINSINIQVDPDGNKMWWVNATGAAWYVRPAGGSYGDEDGTSYVNAWNGFDAIDWDLIEPLDNLYVAGTHIEGLTIGASGTETKNILIRGDFSGDEAVINIEGQADANNIHLIDNNYVTLFNFNSLIGSGLGAGVNVDGTSGTLGQGHNITIRNVDVLRNFASTSGDGFSLNQTAQAEFYNISATKCREEFAGSGSHQCLTTHTDSSAKIYGATFSDSNYWFVNTLNSKIEAYNITTSSARVAGVLLGNDATSESYVKIYDSTCTFDVGGLTFGTPSAAAVDAGLEIHRTTINATSSTITNTFGNILFNECVLNINDSGWRLAMNEGEVIADKCIFDIQDNGSYVFGSATSTPGYMTIKNNDISQSGGLRFAQFAGTGSTKSKVYNNEISDMSASDKFIWITNNSNAPLVSNNTFYRSSAGGKLIDLDHSGSESSAFQLIFKNNICENITDVVDPAGGAVFQESNNCFFNSEDLGGTGDITDDPEFVTPGTDFHLQTTSPCRDTAEDLSVFYTTDKDGVTRVAWDMGAYEFVS